MEGDPSSLQLEKVYAAAAAAAESLQACLILCGPMDSRPPGSPVHRILQARVLAWVAISFSREGPYTATKTQDRQKQIHKIKKKL